MSFEPKTGGCFCGRIRYRIDAPLSGARSCHCSRCRKAFSGAGSAYAEVDAEAFTWTAGEDALTIYETAPGWGMGFCSRCGGNLFWWLDEGDQVSIFAGTLDGSTGLKIAEHIHTDTKGDYYDIPGRF